MFQYLHRINTLELLQSLPQGVGIEFDVRDSGGRLIVTHDPFTDGPDFHVFAEFIGNRPCIVNIKSEGIEPMCMEILAKAGVTDYFFLDSSFPMIVKMSNFGHTQFAVRYSEFESMETIFAMQNRAQWVWVDSFTSLILTKEVADAFHEAGFRLCLVSPELQGRALEIDH